MQIFKAQLIHTPSEHDGVKLLTDACDFAMVNDAISLQSVAFKLASTLNFPQRPGIKGSVH